MTKESIICAISTPPGSGGIAVIRLSGKGSIKLTDNIFTTPTGKHLQKTPPNTASFGEIKNKNHLIDQVIVTTFHAPHSYTGEDTIEITCHGSTYIQQQILQLLINQGARLATPGEFTQRAFLNGKIDLSQAEAVADLIASTSAGMHKLALNQMKGSFSNKLSNLRSQLLHFTTLIELELDFSEEDVEFANRANLKQLATQIKQHIKHLADSFNVGNAIKNGIPVAIIGETNAGKSTLLNLLIGEERAIVSPIHGTTRDIIEDTINLSGITFRFIDTAGIRETTDTIETLGIERTYQKLHQATIILWIIDLTSTPTHLKELASIITPHLKNKETILVFNKSDLSTPTQSNKKRQLFNPIKAKHITISAKKNENIDTLKQHLLEAAAIPEISQNDVIITNVRHYEALTQAHSAISRVLDGLDQNISADFLSQDIRECMHYLGEITGQISNDEILSNIFQHFCIGK
ncbi:MAG: tRNA uridine-5-carboxymethylaminomethyl(34) synthesis GTPase MnmE [Tannerellaceae bacterium]|nr:tRNA uridine-5-carboxymethylaminomethyl(34) synthesis GTPase MnmE [Tannerellaceae bacterium]